MKPTLLQPLKPLHRKTQSLITGNIDKHQLPITLKDTVS